MTPSLAYPLYLYRAATRKRLWPVGNRLVAMTWATFCKWLLLAICSLGFSPAHAAGVAMADLNNEGAPLGQYLDYLEDPQATLSLQDVMNEPYAHRFRPAEKKTPNFGFTQSAYWFRLDIRNDRSTVANWLLENQYPLTRQIEAYIVYADQTIIHYQSGSVYPFSHRIIKHRNSMFDLPLAKGQSARVYLRLKTGGSMQLPLTLRTLRGLFAKDHEEQLILGAYYGILIAMFLYNLMIFLSIRDIAYLYYLYYLVGWILFQMSVNGLTFEYLWPNYPWLSEYAFPASCALCAYAVVQFTRSLLQVKNFSPKFDTLLRAYLVIWVAIVIAIFFTSYTTIIKVCAGFGIITTLTVFIMGVVALREQVRQARYFMLAWSVLLCSIVGYGLMGFGVLPATFLTEYGMQIGSALEVVLLSFSLAHRMRLLKEENEHIQRHAAQELEQRVQQRTSELNKALDELSFASEQLKSMSRVDGLTLAKNRSYFNECIEFEWHRTQRGSAPLSLLMIDIDHFKSINDRYGHLGGDACLQQVAEAIYKSIQRTADELFRYGGEEFSVILPATDLAGALHLAESIRRSIEALPIVYNGQEIRVTASIGVAQMHNELHHTSNELINAADMALYEAKRTGRNRICTFPTPSMQAQGRG